MIAVLFFVKKELVLAIGDEIPVYDFIAGSVLLAARP